MQTMQFTNVILLCFSIRGVRHIQNSSVLRQTDDSDKPLKYSTSDAHKWKAYESFEPPEKLKNRPKCEPVIIGVTTAVFLLYFLVFREENDWDIELGTSIYARIPGVEESSLVTAIKDAERVGTNPEPLKERLAELRASRKKV